MARLLVLNFFPAFHPASSGGELRVGNLYRALANTHDVTLLTSTDPGARNEELLHQARFREIRFPKDELWRRAYATLEAAGLEGELSGAAFALAVSDPSCRLRQAACELAASADFIIHEFPYSEPIFAGGAAVPEIYNAHNFEIGLLASVMRGPGFDRFFLKLMRMEGNLAARARHVFAASPDEADRFRLFYGIDPAKLAICPNGFDDAELGDIAAARQRKTSWHARPRLLFMASHHAPNVEAATFLIALAAQLPACDIILAGGVCREVADREPPPNVILHGAFDNAAKRRLLLEADLFLNPVTAGSGTSLKALEALGAGVPMVAVPEGVRGLGLRHLGHVMLAARENFAAAIRHLLAGRAQARRIAAAGRALAVSAFTWSQIAAKFNARLPAAPPAGPPAGDARAPIFLALNDYPVHRSASGGAARIRGLLASSPADTVLVTFGTDYDFVLLSPRLLAVTVPKTGAHRRAEQEINRAEINTANDIAASLFAASHRVLVTITLALARRARAVMFEHPYMAPLLPALRRFRTGVPVIYSAHNVEARHKAELWRAHKAGAVLAGHALTLERYLVETADLILCCTAADEAAFAAPGRTVMVVPNGCDVPERAAIKAAARAGDGDEPHRIGFLGSAHGPNILALRHIAEVIAPQFPRAIFEVIGEVCGQIAPPASGNVILHGVVDEAAKTAIMANWTLALNPVLTGGGSSLKLADYLAHGLVSISTPAGARGYELTAHDAGYVAELAQFGAVIRTALSDPARPQMAANAYRYATETLSWPVCTRDYRAYLEALPAEGFATIPAAARSLLVVTDEYAEPPAGAAQIYLTETLRQLRLQFGRIDLAAVDSARLSGHRHFATRTECAGEGAAARIGELFDQAVYFAPDEPPGDVMARCRALEADWTRAEPRLFAAFADLWAWQDAPMLFGGFYPPERDGAARGRWSAPEFAILIPAGSRVLRLRGAGPAAKLLRVEVARIDSSGAFQALARLSRPMTAGFDIALALPAARGGAPCVVLCQVEAHQAADDHRPLGVLLESASVLRDHLPDRDQGDEGFYVLEERSADLARDLEAELSGRALQPWIMRLRREALAQSDSAAEDFDAVYKVHSSALRRWLPAVERYDVILVNGRRSDALTPIRQAISGMADPPLVVALTHFHGADRMDYWRHDLEMMAAGPSVLFSEHIAEVLQLGDRAKIVPAGGVHAGDALDPAGFIRFQDVDSPRRPFFLVIARETAAPWHARAVNAQLALSQEGIDIGLVVTGAGGAGGTPGGEAPGFGETLPEVFYGALSACLGVIDLDAQPGFPEAICQAWLFGKPVIASRRHAACRDIIRHGENGWLVGADWELLDAMRRLASDAALCRRLGEAGFAEVHRRYTWPAVAQAWLDVLAGGRGSG